MQKRCQVGIIREECFPFDSLLCAFPSTPSYLGTRTAASVEFIVFLLSLADVDQMEFMFQSSLHATS